MRYRFQSGERIYQVSIERRGAGYQAAVDGHPFEIEILDSQPGQLVLRSGWQILNLFWAAEAGRQWVSFAGCTYLLEKPSARPARRPGERAAEDIIRAPMPAQIRAVQVVEGEEVEKGHTLVLLEAMKMEIRLRAPRSGRVIRLLIKEGQPVDRDQVLVEIGD